MARSAVAVSPLFSDHAVLQRDKPLAIWGTATPGEKIVVQFHAQVRSAVADLGGRWLVRLNPEPSDAESSDLRIVGTNSLVAHDVVVGEVWLCSGQSNVTFPVARVDNATVEIAAAQYPLIRHFGLPQTVADQPASTLRGAWAVCSPQSVGQFTAVGYFFARELQRRLKIPIGIVRSAVGGTAIESWMSAESLAGDPAFAVVAQRRAQELAALPANLATFSAVTAAWKRLNAAAQLRGQSVPAPVSPANIRPTSAPSGLFNGMIHPLLPLSLRGVLWYQGESNAVRAAEYRALFTTLITDWRMRFGQGPVPFYWVNLPNYGGDSGSDGSFARLRAAQTQALALPATGQAIALDLGEAANIHPPHKQEVGRRLALVAEANTYGLAVEASGPTVLRAVRIGNAVRIEFLHASGGLLARGPIQNLELAGSDGIYVPACGSIQGERLIVTAQRVTAPLEARYAWSNSPHASLYNQAGLPAAPFQARVEDR